MYGKKVGFQGGVSSRASRIFDQLVHVLNSQGPSEMITGELADNE